MRSSESLAQEVRDCKSYDEAIAFFDKLRDEQIHEQSIALAVARQHHGNTYRETIRQLARVAQKSTGLYVELKVLVWYETHPEALAKDAQ